MAAAEQVRIGVDARAVAQAAVERIRLVPVGVRTNAEVQKVGIVKAAAQVRIPVEPHAVGGSAIIDGPVVVVSQVSVEIEFPRVANLQLRRGRHCQQQQPRQPPSRVV